MKLRCVHSVIKVQGVSDKLPQGLSISTGLWVMMGYGGLLMVTYGMYVPLKRNVTLARTSQFARD